MRLSTRRRVAATAVAALTTLAVAGPAVADTAAPHRFAGTADALSLELTLTGPTELMSQITSDGSDTLAQRISHTVAQLHSEQGDEVVARLAQGFLAPLDSGATSGEAGSGREELQAISQGPLTLEAGVIEWELVPDALSRSFSELAMVSVSLAPVLAELPEEARQPLQDAVEEATGTVNDLVGELNGVLGQIEDTVNEVDDQAPVDLPEVTPDALPLVPDVTSVDLLTARKLWSESVVETVDGVIRSTARSGVTELSLLGGLVRVPALQYVAVAETGGTPGTGQAMTDVETIAVEVGDYVVEVAGTVLTVGDVSIDLADPQLDGVPLGDLLGEVEGILADLIAAGGLSIAQGEGVTEVADDGSSASAATSAFALRLRPLNAAGDADVLDLAVRMMPTRAATTADITPARVEESTPAMPRTGGGGVAMLLGLTAMGGALVLRRR